MPNTFHIAVLPGDGIGPDVTAECVKVLRAVESRLEGIRFELEEFSVGAGEYLRSGDPLPAAAFERSKQCDAILLGAMGLPGVRWPNGTEMTPQIDLRDRLELYAGVRPIRLYHAGHSPLKKYGAGEIEKHFRFFDTICGATQDRQDALQKLLVEPMNLLVVIGGYNSSNTSHLAEMGEAKLPTYFIKNAGKMASDKLIVHYNQHLHKEVETHDWLPSGKITVGITAGASCPNNLIEDTIRRLF